MATEPLPVMPEGSEDTSDEYLQQRREREIEVNTSSFDEWLAAQPTAGTVPGELPLDPFPVDQKPPEKQSTAGRIVRNVSEIPRQAVGGVDDFMRNATGFLNPVTDWLNENVADLRYDPVSAPKTTTGRITRSASRFMTGFIPALKAMRAFGAAGAVAPLAAGAISDVLGTGAQEKRLADLWVDAGLPQNVLTDFLSSDPDDGIMETKFKTALEGVLVGGMLEGVLRGAKALRGMRAARKVQAAAEVEQQALKVAKEQYGEITEEVSRKVLGDKSTPLVEVVGKIDDAVAATGKVQAREILESSGKLTTADLKKIPFALPTTGETGAKATAMAQAREEIKKGTTRAVEVTLDAVGGPKITDGRHLLQAADELGVDVNVRAIVGDQVLEGPAARVAIAQAMGKARQGVYINFARIDSPDEVKAVIDDLAQRFSGSIKEAQRGVISQRETAKLADDLGMTAADLLARRRGAPFNAETALAARRLWAASADNLLSLAKKAAGPNAGQVDQFAFRKALAAHHAIQAEVIGARTETARALASWRIPAGGGVEQAKAIQELVEASGGKGISQDLAKRLTILAEHGDKRALGEFVEKAWGATTFDAVREVWINGLLSSPSTHVVNVTSNALVAFQQMYERGTASLIGQVRGTQGGVQPGEALAMTHGLTSGLKDAWRLAWKAFKTGETGASLGKIDLPHKTAISSEGFRISSETGLGRAVDMIGTAARIPGRFLGAEDEFFKTIGYRMELHAQALRQATQEGLKGKALTQRMSELLLHPPQHIRIAATDAALYNTFTNQAGAVGQTFLKMREKIPATTFVIPFVKTPVNIARYTFERTPFAPLVGQWRADILAGGARADIALARMATGTAIMLTALDYADSGRISGSGPADPTEREAMARQGWQPYSIKVGNRWYSYNRTDPLGTMLGFAADVSERISRGEITEDDVDEWQEVMAMGITAVSQVAVNKTYLRGMSQFVEVMEDPQRYGERYVSDMVASFVPFTALSGAIERAVDPTVRESGSPWDAIRARMVSISEQLPPRRNLWGEEIRAESGIGKAYDFFSPVQSREIKPSPIDSEIMRLAPIGAMDNTYGAAPARIGKRSSFQGVQVNFKEWPEVYDRYVQLSGNELKHPAWKKGAKDFLNDVVSGKHVLSKVYKMNSDPMKLQFIGNMVQQYREMAQREIMSDPEFSTFAIYVNALKADKQRQRMPVIEGAQ